MELQGINHFTKYQINLNIPKIKLLKYNLHHFVIVTINNEVYVYGENKYGTIGLGKLNKVTEIVKINNLNIGNIKTLDCGKYFTIIVNDNSDIYVAGYIFNVFQSSEFTLFKDLNFNEEIKKVTCGNSCVIMLTNTNTIYGLGENGYGQLGLPEIKYYKKFKKLTDLKVKDVQCGLDHTILLDFNNDIYTTGCNSLGQLGLISNDYEIHEFTKVVNFKAIKVFASRCNSFILTENNKLYGAGLNRFGQLGMGQKNSSSKFIKLKLTHCNEKTEILKSFGQYTCAVHDSDIYFSGKSELFGINNCDHFTKFSFGSIYYYRYPILMGNNIFILCCDYKILNETEEEENNLLNLNLLQKLQNGQLIDIEFN